MKKLYIIGNGFDLYHDLPTSYKCFNCFMCRKYSEAHERIGRMFDLRDANVLWSDFENKLGELKVLDLVDSNLSSWLITERVQDFENSFDVLHIDLSWYFQEWVGNIEMSCANSKRLGIDKEARFINFNYSPTLEKLYSINEDQICYIHGDTGKNAFRAPIVGHGKNYLMLDERDEDGIKQRIECLQQLPVWTDTQEEFEEKTILEVKKLLYGLRKNTNRVLGYDDIKKFFNNCTKSEEIYVLGHSLAEVDLPYFEKIAHESPDAKWYASYKTDKDKENVENMRKVCGIDHIKLITLDELLSNQV